MSFIVDPFTVASLSQENSMSFIHAQSLLRIEKINDRSLKLVHVMILRHIRTVFFMLGLLAASDTILAAQQCDKSGPVGKLGRLVDLEIHTHTLSENEKSNIGHYIM